MLRSLRKKEAKYVREIIYTSDQEHLTTTVNPDIEFLDELIIQCDVPVSKIYVWRLNILVQAYNSVINKVTRSLIMSIRWN